METPSSYYAEICQRTRAINQKKLVDEHKQVETTVNGLIERNLNPDIIREQIEQQVFYGSTMLLIQLAPPTRWTHTHVAFARERMYLHLGSIDFLKDFVVHIDQNLHVRILWDP